MESNNYAATTSALYQNIEALKITQANIKRMGDNSARTTSIFLLQFD